MKNFEFHRPRSVAEAVSVLHATADARPLAGGMTLIPSMKLRLAAPPAVVDLGAIAELRGIVVTGGSVVLGAMTRHVEVASAPEIAQRLPALAALAGGIGDPQVRHRGTVGGSLASNDPAADYPAAALALNATIVTDRRRIPAAEFFRVMFDTALQTGELITQVEFPLPLAAAYEKFRSPASRYALAGVFVARTATGVRVAVTGAASSVFRATMLEAALDEKFTPDALARLRYPATNLNADMHADAEFRAHLIGVLTRRAVETILARGSAR